MVDQVNALADETMVIVESVQGGVTIYLSDSGTSRIPVKPMAGDVLIAPLIIETDNDSSIDLRVDEQGISIAAGSSIVIPGSPEPEFNWATPPIQIL